MNAGTPVMGMVLGACLACSNAPGAGHGDAGSDAGAASSSGGASSGAGGSSSAVGASSAAGSSSSSGAAGASSSGGAVDCDPRHAFCTSLPPACGAGEVPRIQGACWGPCVPVSQCQADAQVLCLATGGSWVTDDCGDYACGQPSGRQCVMAQPGCNCGHLANAVDGQGCVNDPGCPALLGDVCAGRGATLHTCGAGLRCPGPGANDAPGYCELDSNYTCGAQAGCAQGLLCCYPCGVAGCHNTCLVPLQGQCPLFP